MKTLVVEDNFIARTMIQKMLLPYGQCDVVVNGKEAMQVYEIAINESKPYDLICLDIIMPELDGKQVLKKIRDHERSKQTGAKNEVKIIMISALDAPKDIIESFYEGGCTTYLVKPIEKKQLIGVIKEYGLLE